MEPLNYCRQATRYFLDCLDSGVSDDAAYFCKLFVPLMAKCQKFILPDQGVLFEDVHLRGISDLKKLTLPFDYVALEFQASLHNESGFGKSIICLEQREDKIIAITAAGKGDDWGAAGTWMIARKGAVASDREGALFEVQPAHFLEAKNLHPESFDYRHNAVSQCQIVLNFLNALACSNVTTETVEARKASKKSAAHALPFDSYHVLTIKPSAAIARDGVGGSHRSPREHLRRGHIRRLESGARVWVNATVVNPGIGGKVSKDYRVAA